MDDKPTLEETKRDIEITKKELEAYRKLQQGYNILTYDIPDQLPTNRLEYGMKDGVLQLSCRQALLYYALRRLRLEDELSEDAVSQQLTLLNRDELKPFIDQVESKASHGTRPTV